MKKIFFYCLSIFVVVCSCSKYGDGGSCIDPDGQPKSSANMQTGTKNEVRVEGDRGLLIDPNGSK